MDSHTRATSPPPLPTDRTGVVVFLWLVPIVVGAVVFWKLAQLPLPACIFHGVSGIPCPTCGMNRGLGLLLAGDVLGAAALNPLTILLPLILFVVWVVVLSQRLGFLPHKWAALPRATSSKLLRISLIFLVAGVWLYLLARRFG